MNKQRLLARQTGRNIEPPSYAHLGGRRWVRRVARAMSALFVLQCVLSVLPAYAQSVSASSNAPAGQRPLLDAARNGVPLVHIAPPSRAGVSRNQYDQFNVNQNGLILNNSPTNVQTQQGGWITGNQQLGPTPARIILNEVVSGNPSQLRGTIEVAGKRADIVVANPNGITCDGCGFLNADRATLATGRAQMTSDGSIQGFDVRQGQLKIGGNGINASNLEQLDLIARGIVIEGEVWAKNLNAIAGANQVLYGALQAATQGGTGAAPRFSIDIKELGGMYANQVYLVATEKGLGVNSTGRIAALQGNLVLSANGDLSNAGTIAQRNAEGASINAAGQISNSGTIYSAGQLKVDPASLSNSGGSLLAGGDVNIRANTVTNSAPGSASAIAAAGSVNIAAGSLSNASSTISAGQDVTLAVSNGALSNQGGAIEAGRSLVANTGELNNRTGRMIANGTVSIEAKSVDSADGILSAADRVAIESAGTFSNVRGQITSNRSLGITAASLDNTAGVMSVGDATLNAAALDNTGGSITATNNLTVFAANLTNTSGRLVADSSVTVNTNSRAPGGTIASAGDVTLTVNGDYANSGKLSANRDLTVNASNIDNTGTLTAGENLTAHTGNLNNAGEISAEFTNLNVTGTLTNQAIGLIDGTSTNIHAATTNNTGRIYGDVLSIKGTTINNTGRGAIAARNTLLIGAHELNNTNGGLITSLGDLHMAGSLDISGHPIGEMRQLTNASARIEAAGNMRLSVANLNNRNDGLTTRTATYAEPSNKTLIQPNGSPNKFDVSVLGWDPYFKDRKGRYVALSSDYPFARFGAVSKEPAVTTVCGGGDSWECTTTHHYPPEHPIWSLFNVAPPYFGDLVKPSAPTAAEGNIWGTGCMMQVGDGGMERSPYGVCGTYWAAVDAYDATVAQRTKTAESALDIKIFAFNRDLEARSFGEWYEYQVTNRTVSETAIDTNRPAQIVAGGQLTVTGSGNKVNDNSRIIAGGPIAIGGSQVQNLGIDGTRSVTEKGQVRFRRIEHHGGFCDCYEIELSAWSPTTGAPSVETFKIPNTTYAPFGGNQTANRNLAGKTAVPETVKAGGAVATLFGGTPLNVPTSSLFKLPAEPNARYLIETDPRFTDYREFVSSDYFLQALNRDPERQLKRYGDGFTEQQMVNDQILALTGRRYLSGYTDTETEYRALMDAGVAFAKHYQLTPGVALTGEQMALLTTDLVWLTTQTVVLPNGQTEQVLVSQVYLRRPKEGDLQTAGGLIAGSDITIKTEKDLTNSGTIAGNRSTTLVAGNDLLNQGGRISGARIYARAGNDLKNLSGVIQGSGDQVALLAGRDIVLQTRTIDTHSAATATTAASNRTSIDRIATIQGGNVLLDAARDLTAEGSAVKADANLVATAGRDIKVTSVAGSYELAIERGGGKTKGITAVATGGKGKTSYIKEESTTNQVATFDAGNDIALIAGESGQGRLSLEGTDVSAGNDAVLQGKSVTIEAAKNDQLTDVQNVRKNSRTRTLREDEAKAGGNIVAGNKLTVHADGKETGSGDVAIKSAYLSSQHDQATIVANNDVHIGTVTTEHRAIDESYSKNSGTFSTKTTAKSSVGTAAREEGSAITGNRVAIAAGDEKQKRGDITIRGSSVIADKDVVLNAGNNIDITTAQQTFDYQSSEDKKKSGMFSGGGAGITLGTQQTNQNEVNSGVAHIGSAVGSLTGNVSINAGNQATQTGSQITALLGDVDILAKKVEITHATDTANSSQEQHVRQSGLSIGASNGIVSAAQSIGQMGSAAADTGDARMKALAAATAALTAKNAIDTLKDPAQATSVTLSITVGKSKSDSSQRSSSVTAVGSKIVGGLDVTVRATGTGENSTLTLLGSDIQAGNNATVESDGKMTLQAAQNTSEQHSQNSSSSAGIGVAVSVGAKTGVGITANASKGSGHSNGSDITWTNSHIAAGNVATVQTDSDAHLKGAVVAGKQVVADIKGDLTIESLQDTTTYESKSKNIGGSVTVGISNMGPLSGSIAAGKSNIDSTYASVTEQSGFKAGENGYQVKVDGKTDLVGGVIASSQTAINQGKNSFEGKGGITQSDIVNTASYSGNAVSISASNDAGKLQGVGVGLGSANGNAKSVTKSGIGVATETDTTGAIAKIFDAQKVSSDINAQVAITQAFSQQAPKAIANYAGSKAAELNAQAANESDPQKKAALEAEAQKWSEGGAYRVALHSISGALAGGLSGAAGAAVSARSAQLMNELQSGAQAALQKAGLNEDVAKVAAQGVADLAALGMGATVGGTQGAATALTVDANNRQLHPDDYAVAKALAKKSGGKYTEEEILSALRYSGIKDANGGNIVAEGTQEILITNADGKLVNVKSGTTIQDTYKADGTISLRPDKTYPTVLVEDAPARPSNDLMAYITANTGGAASPYVLTPSATLTTNSSLPAAPAGTRRVTTMVDGVAYFPLVANCPAASCTNGSPIANAVQDDATKAYLDAIDRKVEKDLNVATAVVGGVGSVVRAVKAVEEIVSTAAAANTASKAASVGANSAVPHGFASADEFAQFGSNMRAGLGRAGYENAEPILQGSAVTGKSFKTGQPFDVGRVSDFDIGLADPSMLARAKELGIGLRSGGTRTGPLTERDLRALGVFDLSNQMGQQAGREVNFMIYNNPATAIQRAPSVILPGRK